uniref:Protein kinase domain-containing protein n=1 Tax=Wuchereria bancrofti TaxID=6293 RepID=A0A1I8EHC2_WUCBA
MPDNIDITKAVTFRIELELQALSRLIHDNIVKFYEQFRGNGAQYISSWSAANIGHCEIMLNKMEDCLIFQHSLLIEISSKLVKQVYNRHYNQKVDVYSLGVHLMLTGYDPPRDCEKRSRWKGATLIQSMMDPNEERRISLAGSLFLNAFKKKDIALF